MKISHASTKSPQDRLRTHRGELTGLRLVEQSGFKQAHISNFLNCKRGLSLEGMDQSSERAASFGTGCHRSGVNKRASIFPPSADEFNNVVVADTHIAPSKQ